MRDKIEPSQQLLAELEAGDETKVEAAEKQGWFKRHNTLDPSGTPTLTSKVRQRDLTDPDVWDRIDKDKSRAHEWAEADVGNNGENKKGEPAYLTLDRNMKNDIAFHNKGITPLPHMIPAKPGTYSLAQDESEKFGRETTNQLAAPLPSSCHSARDRSIRGLSIHKVS